MKISTTTAFEFAKADQDLAMMGWFNHHPTQGAPLPSSPEVDAFVNTTWPMSSQYYSPINGVWLMQVTDVRTLGKRPFWLIRDGAVPLTWFFHRHPQPPQAETRLFIDEDLIHLVPAAWSTHVGSYRLHSEAPPTEESRAAIVGLAAENYASLKFVRERAKMIAQHESGVASFDLYLPARWSTGGDEDRESFHANYFHEIYRAFPQKTRVFTRTELIGTFDLQNVRVWDLNEKLMISDNTLVQALLKKGAQWPRSRAAMKEEKYVKLSNFHGFILNSAPEVSTSDDIQSSMKSAQRFHEKVDDLYRSSAFREFPWPNWFAQWVQSAALVAPPVLEKSRQQTSKAAKRAPKKSPKASSKKRTNSRAKKR